MEETVNEIFDEERAMYARSDLTLKGCSFSGPADGESALKECRNIKAEGCLFNLRYPLWHDDGVIIENCDMTALCRAALWYSRNIKITKSKLNGIKALRECAFVTIDDCEINSPEFGWSVNNLKMSRCSAESEYFMMRSSALEFSDVKFKGKYSFQYVHDSVFDNCVFDTKDAFWHAENVVVKNSVVKGEYLGWYCKNVTFENCKIIGTQPLCYCKGLKLIDCEMYDADLCFEKSEVEAKITTPVISVKNPLKGRIYLPYAQEIIFDDKNAKGKIITVGEKKKRQCACRDSRPCAGI